MNKQTTFRLVCTMDGKWHIDVMMANVGPKEGPAKFFWTTIKSFEEKHQAGYEAATKWIKENML